MRFSSLTVFPNLLFLGSLYLSPEEGPQMTLVHNNLKAVQSH
jgi:hypothetical protein